MVRYRGSEQEWSTRVESVDEGYIALHELINLSFAEESASINGISVDVYDLWESDDEGEFYVWVSDNGESFKEYCEARDLENRFCQMDYVREFEPDVFDEDDIYG